MNIGILGTGTVAKTIAEKLEAIGHAVKLGTRDVKATLAREESQSSVASWLGQHKKVTLGTLAEAAAHGDVLFNALSGQGTIEGLRAAGADRLAAKVLIDVSNPLDFSKGMPPSLSIVNTDSLAEHIQREFPKAKVVKSLNTANASLMVNPKQLAGGDHTMFVSGNDAAAKTEVTKILKEWFGWQDVIDLGDLSNARAQEMWLPMWLRVWGALKTPMFTLKIVR